MGMVKFSIEDVNGFEDQVISGESRSLTSLDDTMLKVLEKCAVYFRWRGREYTTAATFHSMILPGYED